MQQDKSDSTGAFFPTKWTLTVGKHISKESCAYGSHFSPQTNRYAIHTTQWPCWPIVQLQPNYLETACHAIKRCHFIYRLKLSSSLAMSDVTVFAACIMFWHVPVYPSCSFLFHVTRLLTLELPIQTHNGHSTWAVSSSQGTESLYTGKRMAVNSHIFHSTVHKHKWGGTSTKLVFIHKNNDLVTHVQLHVALIF